MKRRKWNRLENEWKQVVRTAFDKNLKNLELQLNNTKLFHHVNMYPYFKLLDPEEYVDIIMAVRYIFYERFNQFLFS